MMSESAISPIGFIEQTLSLCRYVSSQLQVQRQNLCASFPVTYTKLPGLVLTGPQLIWLESNAQP